MNEEEEFDYSDFLDEDAVDTDEELELLEEEWIQAQEEAGIEYTLFEEEEDVDIKEEEFEDEVEYEVYEGDGEESVEQGSDINVNDIGEIVEVIDLSKLLSHSGTNLRNFIMYEGDLNHFSNEEKTIIIPFFTSTIEKNEETGIFQQKEINQESDNFTFLNSFYNDLEKNQPFYYYVCLFIGVDKLINEQKKEIILKGKQIQKKEFSFKLLQNEVTQINQLKNDLIKVCEQNLKLNKLIKEMV